MKQHIVTLEPALHINLHYDLHPAWSRVQAALSGIGGEVQCTELELSVVEDVTHEQLTAVILPTVLQPEDDRCAGQAIPSDRRLAVVPNGHPLVTEVSEVLGEPVSVGFLVQREDDEEFGEDDAQAVVWNWSVDSPDLDRCYAWARIHELDFVSSVESGRVQMTVTQQVEVPHGGWVRIRTQLAPTGCTAIVDACVHGEGASSAPFMTVWSALQAAFGTLKTDGVRCDALNEHGERTGSVNADFSGVSAKKGSKFKAPKDPYKKRPLPKKPIPKKPKRPKFLLFKGGVPLPGDTPADRLTTLNRVVQALAEGLAPTVLQFNAYEVLNEPLRQRVVDHCGIHPGMLMSSVEAAVLTDGQRTDMVKLGEHNHAAYTQAALAKLGEPNECSWRSNAPVNHWEDVRVPDCVRWTWLRQDHAELDAFTACLSQIGRAHV